MRKKSILLALLAASSLSYGQLSHIEYEKDKDLRHAKYLHLTETYLAAQNKFEQVLEEPQITDDTREAAEFYASLEGLINNSRGAEERFLSFQEKYPNSIYVRNGSWELGSFYLRQGNYDKAYTYLTAGDLNSLPERKRTEYQFKLGYVNFMRGNDEQALRHLEPLTRSSNYQDEASYYVGHIHYANKEFEKAFEYLDPLRKRNSDYEAKVLPYVVQIEFNNQQYEQAIADGKSLLASNDDPFVTSEISKIVGESYFHKQMYNEAIPYLEAYSGTLTNADNYQLGYAYYQKGEFKKAISLFNKIVGEQNAMSQIAYYQLGNAYLQSEQKREALTAFKSSSEMDYDTEVQEDAAYNYAKLSYEIGNPFAGAPEVLQNFTDTYPNSSYTSEINSYLIDAFISSGNYRSALEVLENISRKTDQQKAAQQEAAFLLGTNLIKEGKASEAEEYFALASSMNQNQEVRARSTFWLGETYYTQGKYAEALQAFNQFKDLNTEVEESKEINYQIGYTNLKLRKYAASATAFEEYIATNPPGAFKADAKLRLADAYIGNQETQRALGLYQEIEQQDTAQSDEAAYNRAVVLGILGETTQKIDALENFIEVYPISKYYDNAKFELANAYLKVGNESAAMKQLDDLIAHGKPDMKARASLRKGLIYYNQSKNDKALDIFRSVAEDYPKTELALEAIDNAKLIYIEENNLNEFESWASQLGYYQVNESELEILAYDAAMAAFDAQNFAKAISAYETFLDKYPNSAYSNAINYGLGESYYLSNSPNNAINPLMEVAKTNNKYQEDALLRLSQVYLQNEDNTEALLTLENLNQITNNPAYKTFTEINLMRIYSQRGLHDKAIRMAQNVLDNPKNELSIIQEAKLINARSLFASNKLDRARDAYSQLEKAESNAVKAEALYYKAKFLNQDKDYATSNEVIFNLASQLSDQQYFGSKALVVMADNYYNLDDIYQANATLDAVIANYSDYPDVIQEAETLKAKINNK